jgi:hypothetical protein
MTPQEKKSTTQSLALYKVAQGVFFDTHMQELNVWSSGRCLPHRQASYDVSLHPECLPYPFKNLSLPAIFLCVTEKHAAFW